MLLMKAEMIARLRLNNQLENVEQLAGIATAISHYGSRLAEFNVALLQFHIVGYGPMKEFHEVVALERLEHIQLASLEQRTYHLERRVLGGGTDESNHTALHSTEQRVLLRLAETMYFVDEEYR